VNWLIFAFKTNVLHANGCPVCSQKRKKKVTSCGGLLGDNIRKADVLLVATLAAKARRKKRNKMAGKEEEKKSGKKN
jgi:hypothetical protein